MKKQLTLFGVRKRKREPFFQRSADDSDYTRVIETLWQQDAGQRTRKDFFKWAQGQWRDKYSKDRKARDDVIAKSVGVQQGMDNADEKAATTGYFRRLDEPEPKRSHLSCHGRHDQVSMVASVSTDGDDIEVASGGPEAEFLNAIGIDSSQLLTEDVVGRSDFMGVLRQCARQWLAYKQVQATYEAHAKWRWGHSQLIRAEDELVTEEKKLMAAMCDVAQVTVSATNFLSVSFVRMALEKMEGLAALSARLLKFTNSLQTQTRRLEIRVSQLLQKQKHPADDLVLDCTNGCELSWEKAFGNLADLQSNGADTCGPLSAEELVHTSQVMAAVNVLSLRGLLQTIHYKEDELCMKVQWALTHQILHWMPVMSLLHKPAKNIVLVNVPDLTFTDNGNTFSDVLSLVQEDEGVALSEQIEGDAQMQQEGDAQIQQEAEQLSITLPAKKRGPPARHEQFPEIICSAMSFINMHGYTAQARRRTTAGNSNGVTLAQVQQHLLSSVAGLKDKGIGRTTVHQLMLPPRQKTVNARRYHGVLNVRVPGKRNDEHGCHENGHFCLAQVGYMLEFSQQHSDSTSTFSCDNKNKVNIGTLAVSRYHQLRKFFPIGNGPVYKDHDFPFQNAKIIPSGYLRLEPRGRPKTRTVYNTARVRLASADSVRLRTNLIRSCVRRSSSMPPLLCKHEFDNGKYSEFGHFRKDKLGRLHYTVPHTGPLFVKNRAGRFHESTAETHANDLDELIGTEIRSGKTGICLAVDGGPDYSIKSILTIIAFGRLWRDKNLDFLIMCTHAAGDSCYNRVEHAWSPLSSSLAGVILPASLPGEMSPWQQKLDDIEKEKKIADVFDNALKVLDSYWNAISYDGFPVTSSSVMCLEKPSPYNDHSKLTEFAAAGSTKLKADEGMKCILNELQFLHSHAVRKTHMLQFMKCDSGSCHHCSTRPVRATTAVNFLRRHGGCLMTPRPSNNHEGHYCTFLEAALMEDMGCKPLQLDYGLPSLLGKVNHVCELCNRYVFQSEADRTRHLQRIHNRSKRKEAVQAHTEQQAAPKPSHNCTYTGCGHIFSTQYQLQRHKQETGHKCRAGRKKKGTC
ncbi:uncharacterized protein LOC134190768 [Corticium candelabrum]|uniref:uncharacterized protein LOC134190768 n=1 Tax=Corticium candelabrum TaxID=121492 RepID=UPI002E2585C4|nr:uncharacterized protein LOC134190768 [Corticium candelabrum]